MVYSTSSSRLYVRVWVIFLMTIFVFFAVPTATAKDGELLWTYTTNETLDNESPTLGKDGTILLRFLTDTSPTNPHPREVVGLSPNGRWRWAYPIDTAGFAPLSVGADGTIYVQGTKQMMSGLFALTGAGQEKWFLPEAVGDRAVAVAGDGTVFVCSSWNGIKAVNRNGTLRWAWSVPNGRHWGVAIGPDGTLFAPVEQDLYAFDQAGELKWRRGIDGWVYRMIVNQDGTVFLDTSSFIGNSIVSVSSGGKVNWSQPVSPNLLLSDPAGNLVLTL